MSDCQPSSKPIMLYASGHDPNLTSYFFYDETIELRFDKKTWTYYLVTAEGREPQAGVTSVCHIIDKSEPLMKWAVRKAMEKLRQHLLTWFAGVGGVVASIADRSVQVDVFTSELDKIIEEAKKADREELEAAADTGHSAHDWIESYIKSVISQDEDRRMELLAKYPVDVRAMNCCLAAIEWMSNHDVHWISTERKIYSRRHKYAGTMDGLARVSSCQNKSCCPNEFKDRLTLVDWKTSNYLYIEYLLQTAAYQQAYQEETGEKIEDRWVIRLGKDDAEFEPWHCEGESLFNEDITGFLNALSLSRSVLNIKDRVSEMSKAKTAERRAIAKLEKEERMKIKCEGADKYKGVRKPQCNGGNPCQTCVAKYKERHELPVPVSSD